MRIEVSACGGRRSIQEVSVLIAILDFSTDAADRPAALDQLEAERDQVEAMQGNVAFRVYASREDQTGVTVVHEWDDEASFGGYLGSDSFARSGEILRPLMTGAPVSRRFHAELLETVA
jgi:quinol monooxygenase YgiN